MLTEGGTQAKMTDLLFFMHINQNSKGKEWVGRIMEKAFALVFLQDYVNDIDK